uniref:Uncharacterized protein n=1 Tax=Gossypium raimondii TaxID=29730 RepID=A0A0D2WAJ7_GOSRA|nr:hypothetical protein B456_N018200 [Gossypium raimondii]
MELYTKDGEQRGLKWTHHDVWLVYFDVSVRHRLRKDHGIEGGIPVVFSLEKPKAQLLPFRGPSVGKFIQYIEAEFEMRIESTFGWS